MEKAVDKQVKDFNGRLDSFIASAGIPWTRDLMVDGPTDHYRDVVAIDLDGASFCARAAATHWKRQKIEGTDRSGKKLVNYTAGSFVATASMSGVIFNNPSSRQDRMLRKRASYTSASLSPWSGHYLLEQIPSRRDTSPQKYPISCPRRRKACGGTESPSGLPQHSLTCWQ